MDLARNDSVGRMHINPFLTPVSMIGKSKAFSLTDVDTRSPEKKSCYSQAGVRSWMTVQASSLSQSQKATCWLAEVISQSTLCTEKAEARLRKTEC